METEFKEYEKMYEEIYGFSNIKRAFYNSRHGKLNNPSANKFEINMLTECVQLSDELKDRHYSTGKSNKFTVYYPKERNIESCPFKDKIVQHSYCDNVLYPMVCNKFIYDNYASQFGKGIHFGLDRLQGHLRHYFFSNKAAAEKHRRENNLPFVPVEQGHYADGWILKCDIKKFFAHINHDLVKEKIHKLFDNADIEWLSNIIIDSVSIDNGVGLPIGYQSSQLYALILLNDMDHLIKEKLHIKGYGRYVDDFYLIHKNKAYLQYCLKVITDYLTEYGLELNKKTQILPMKNGIDFLGFHTYLTDTGKVVCKLRKRSKENVKRKLKKFAKCYSEGTMTMRKIKDSYCSWRAHASYGNTYHLIRKMDNYYFELFGQHFND